MISRFSGNVWPNPGFDTILLPNAFIYSNLVERRSTERRKVNLLSPVDVQEVPCGV